MGRVIALALIAVGLPHAGVAGDAAVATRPPEALQTIWNESMLEGRPGYFYNGREERPESASCRQPSGWIWVHQVASSSCGLVVADLRERRWLKSRGGWVVDGGLLGVLEVAGQRIELYGKRVVRHEPYLEPWPHFWIGNKAWNVSHEFFLLSRSKHADRAAVLRIWTVPDPEPSGGYGIVARGRLECQESCETVRVHVMHAHERDVVSELVHVSTSAKP
jgi:hypothetical protein